MIFHFNNGLCGVWIKDKNVTQTGHKNDEENNFLRLWHEYEYKIDNNNNLPPCGFSRCSFFHTKSHVNRTEGHSQKWYNNGTVL